MYRRLNDILPACLALLLVGGIILPAAGQQAGPQNPATEKKPVGDDESSYLQVYVLKYSAVGTLSPVIQSVFADQPGMRMAADERLNGLIVQATKKQHDQLADLISTLDINSVEPKEIKSFKVTDETLQDSIDILRAFAGDVEIAATEGQLLVRGDREAVEEVDKLLMLLSRAASNQPATKSAPPVGDITIEIVWLSEAAGEDCPPYTGPVAGSLKKRGFEDLSEVGTIQVWTTVGSKADVSSGVHGGQMEALLEVDESVAKDQLLIELRLSADLENQPSIRFSTSVNIPISQWVVFGVAAPASVDPTKKPAKSVFLMRLKPSEVMVLEE